MMPGPSKGTCWKTWTFMRWGWISFSGNNLTYCKVQRMKKLKKYWKGTLFFLLWCAITIFFDSRQKQFYLEPDIDSFAKRSNEVFALLEVIVLLIILIYAIIK